MRLCRPALARTVTVATLAATATVMWAAPARADAAIHTAFFKHAAQCVNGSDPESPGATATTTVSNSQPAQGARVRVTTTTTGFPAKVTFSQTSGSNTSYRFGGVTRVQVGWSGVPVVDWGPRGNSSVSGTSVIFSPPSDAEPSTNDFFGGGETFWVEFDAPAPGTAYQPPGSYVSAVWRTSYEDSTGDGGSGGCWSSSAAGTGSMSIAHDDPSNTSPTFGAGEEFDVTLTINAVGEAVYLTSRPSVFGTPSGGIQVIANPADTFPLGIPAGTSRELVYRMRAGEAGEYTVASYPALRNALGGNVPGLSLTANISVASGYVINSTADANDENPGDNVCDTGETVEIGESDVPECTLRAALTESAAHAGTDRIEFEIPGAAVPEIVPATALPAATGPLTIDATTQEAGRVALSGAAIDPAGAVDGLVLDGQDTIVKGVAIGGFPGAGVALRGTGSHEVRGNLIGLAADATTPHPNGRAGILVESPANVIGGAGALANTIAHNGDPIDPGAPEPGDDQESATADFADLTGNILVGANGGAEIAHNTMGAGLGVVAYGPIAASGVDVHDNTITSTVAVAVVYAEGSAGRVQVRANTIGNALKATKLGAVIAEGGAGRTVVSGNTLVGTSVGMIVAGTPESAGIDIADNEFGDPALGVIALSTSGMNVDGNTIAGTLGVLALGDGTSTYGGNTIVDNTLESAVGVVVVAEQDDVISGNSFGDDGDMAAVLVALADSTFSGNDVDTDVGVLSIGPSLPAFGNNEFLDNTFDSDLGLFLIGENSDDVIGNTFNGPGRLDNGNSGDVSIGIFASTSQASRFNDNTIDEMAIGMLLANVGGADITANEITGANAGALVVATEPTARDAARADAAGADLDEESLFAELLGSAAGDSALAWANGAQDLVEIDHTVIYRSAVSGARNEWMRNTITDNEIGVLLAGAVNANQFGDDDLADLANLISRNSAAGLALTGTPGPQDVTVRRNSIYGNGTLGNAALPSGVADLKLVPVDDADSHAPDPDIWEPIENDVGDEDSGPNGLQNRPIITSVAADGTIVRGELWSRADTAYIVDVYAVNACHVSGIGGGQFYLGQVSVVTDATGRGTFVLAPVAIGPGQFATATATETGLVDGPTSEFSRCAARGTVATSVMSAATAGDSELVISGTGLSARDLTEGSEIVINPGGPNEESNTVLGHEATHVVQQRLFGQSVEVPMASALVLAAPLAFDHAPGESIVIVSSAPAPEVVPAVVPVVPARLLETRSGPSNVTVDHQFEGDGRVAAGGVVELTVADRGGVPADASAVLLNVTAVGPDAAGFVTVWPCGVVRPLASNVNYVAGQVVPNAVLAKVGVGGKVCVFSRAGTDLVVDVNGYAS